MNKYNFRNLNSLYKNAYYLIINYGLVSLTGFIFWIFVSNYYSSDNIGIAVAIISAAGFISSLSQLGLNFGLIRYFKEVESKKELLNSIYNITFSMSCLLSFFLAICAYFMKTELLLNNNLYLDIIEFMSLTSFSTLILIQSSIFVAARVSKYSLIQTLVSNIIRIILTILFIPYGILGILSSVTITNIIVFITGNVLLLNRIVPQYQYTPLIERNIIKKVTGYSIENYVSDIFVATPNYILPFIILSNIDSKNVAYFYISWLIAGCIYMLSTSISTSLLAEGSHEPREIGENILKSIKLIFLLVIPSIMIIMFFGDSILSVFNKEYSETSFKMLQILAIAAVPISINNIYITIQRLQNKSRRVIIINAFVTLFTLLSSYALTSNYELIGVGISWLFAHTIVCLYILKTSKNYINYIFYFFLRKVFSEPSI